ncbi:MAG TPA: DUF3048 domain-containing protein [Actinomycetota bacterium]|nr:DUF3048 domain-containing protein [Actinomycetota bacterium]
MSTPTTSMPRAGRLPGLRWFAGTAALLMALAACSGKSSPTANKKGGGASPTSSPAPPPVCPLTGVAPSGGSVPNRPVLGVKVENAPEARPQTGLNTADIVYEQPVEGGITRFLAIYQCSDAARIEPVRSSRLQDIDLLQQFPKPLFGNAGGSPPTEAAITNAVKAGILVNIDYSGAGYSRDAARNNDVHSLYTSTSALYGRSDAKGAGGVPTPIFTFSATPTAGAPGGAVHVNFSQYSNVTWKYVASSGVYQRFYNGTQPANESDGSLISTTNIVIQMVPVTMSSFIEDPSGSHQPVPTLTGTGPAVVCRQGTCVSGVWSRSALTSPTAFNDATGQPIQLAPGQTWVELAPSSATGPTAIPVAQVTETAS